MQTRLTEQFLADPRGQRANEILRKCVHCGFCNATCPTHEILGNELDGPRGRIYQIKQILEGQSYSHETRQHLDQCLTCLNCETTCPSGVDYGELLDIGREIIEENTSRPLFDRFRRYLIRESLAYPDRFAVLLGMGRIVRPFLPPRLQAGIPAKSPTTKRPVCSHSRKVLLAEGCVQPVLSPSITAATCRVLDQLDIEAITENPPACCGALHHHTSAPEQALNFARSRIDAWWPHVEAGIEAIISTASGCGVHIKHYGKLLEHDMEYAEKSRKINELTKDLVEVIDQEDTTRLRPNRDCTVACHSPCTLQHGQKLAGRIESLLDSMGVKRISFNESHLCCGAAGSYTLLQPTLSRQLKKRKLENISREQPDMIVTANIGCLHHLASGTSIPVRHWVELIAD